MDRSDRCQALLLIDFRDDFLADHGRMPVARDQVEPVLAATRAAIAQAQARGDLIVQIGNEFRPEVVVAGLYARACVAATAKAALARGFHVQVLGDAVACRSDASREGALGRLRGFGAQVIHGGSYP